VPGPAEAYEKLALLWDFVESEGCALNKHGESQFHREDGEEMVERFTRGCVEGSRDYSDGVILYHLEFLTSITCLPLYQS